MSSARGAGRHQLGAAEGALPSVVAVVGSGAGASTASSPWDVVHRPEGDRLWTTLVCLHGGSRLIGDLDAHDTTAGHICRGSGAVVAVDYRLAPEHPFPCCRRRGDGGPLGRRPP
ncbi:alpha/beta hydrolase fold domain-containing protein [Geodermatophilus sp. SYSU D01180]